MHHGISRRHTDDGGGEIILSTLKVIRKVNLFARENLVEIEFPRHNVDSANLKVFTIVTQIDVEWALKFWDHTWIGRPDPEFLNHRRIRVRGCQERLLNIEVLHPLT